MDICILIVDDDNSVRELMKEYMGMMGYKAVTASWAHEALKILEKEDFHVVITDIMMPGMSGLELTKRIKANHDVEVIVVTGYGKNYSYEDAIEKGASDFIFKPVRFEELHLRLKRVLKEQRLKKELENLAVTDGLTNLYNSRHFYARMNMETERVNRYGHPLSIMMLDIDHFKKFNDAYGHLEGDHALVRVAGIIRSCLRKTDSAYRYGGEEFTVILPETTAENALIVAQRIHSSVNSESFEPIQGKIVYITVSIGITTFCRCEKIADCVHRADQAMFRSKEKGRNRITTQYPDEK